MKTPPGLRAAKVATGKTLYIAGTAPNQLGRIDLTTLQVTRIGAVPGRP